MHRKLLWDDNLQQESDHLKVLGKSPPEEGRKEAGPQQRSTGEPDYNRAIKLESWEQSRESGRGSEIQGTPGACQLFSAALQPGSTKKMKGYMLMFSKMGRSKMWVLHLGNSYPFWTQGQRLSTTKISKFSPSASWMPISSIKLQTENPSHTGAK